MNVSPILYHFQLPCSAIFDTHAYTGYRLYYVCLGVCTALITHFSISSQERKQGAARENCVLGAAYCKVSSDLKQYRHAKAKGCLKSSVFAV